MVRKMQNLIPTDPNTRLTRKATAAGLTASGFPISPATLATMASRGGGPPYELWGPRVTYHWGSSLDWARSRLSTPRRSSAEANVQNAPAITT
jgi:hypothetical protein